MYIFSILLLFTLLYKLSAQVKTIFTFPWDSAYTFWHFLQALPRWYLIHLWNANHSSILQIPTPIPPVLGNFLAFRDHFMNQNFILDKRFLLLLLSLCPFCSTKSPFRKNMSHNCSFIQFFRYTAIFILLRENIQTHIQQWTENKC